MCVCEEYVPDLEPDRDEVQLRLLALERYRDYLRQRAEEVDAELEQLWRSVRPAPIAITGEQR